jgi:hypothetical protein
MRAWRIILIAIAVAMAVGLGVSLNAYFHARAAADRRATEAEVLQSELAQLQAAQAAVANENSETTAALERTAEQLAEAQAAEQQAVADSQQTAAQLDQTANELADLQAAHEQTLEEYRNTVKTLQDTITKLTTVQSQSSAARTPSDPSAVGASTAGRATAGSTDNGSGSPFAQIVGSDQAAICGRTSGLTAPEREVIECWATTLVWKQLGRPRYAELTVTQIYESAVANVWHVVGRFACIGAAAQPFAGTIKRLPNDEWRLLAFSWSATEPGGAIPRAPQGGCCSPLPISP